MHHNDLYDSVKTVCNAKMLLSNLIAGFLYCWRFKVDFLHAGTYQVTLQIDGILDGRLQASSRMPK